MKKLINGCDNAESNHTEYELDTVTLEEAIDVLTRDPGASHNSSDVASSATDTRHTIKAITPTAIIQAFTPKGVHAIKAITPSRRSHRPSTRSHHSKRSYHSVEQLC